MGKFIYSETVKIDIEDRALAHVHAVIAAKLRRGEPFFFTWREDSSLGDGRTSVWIHPAQPLVFKFYGSRRPALNPAWVDAFAHTANSPRGLHLVPEPPEPSAASNVSEESA